MTPLTHQQTQRVADYLAAHRLPNSLREELLDHLCCEIEYRMTAGAAFDAAFTTCQSDWTPARFRTLRRQTYYLTQFKPMLLKLTAAVLLIVTGTTFTDSGPVTASDAFPIPAPLLAADTYDPPTASPLAGVALSDTDAGFGMRTHPVDKRRILHRGIDFRARPGTPVLATATGRVTFAGTNGNYGVQVRIAHADDYVTTYSHLRSVAVSVGQTVDLGERVGEVGSTGQSTGPHLHYEVRRGKRPIDPVALLE